MLKTQVICGGCDEGHTYIDVDGMHWVAPAGVPEEPWGKCEYILNGFNPYPPFVRLPRKYKKMLKRSGLLMDGRPGMSKPYWSHKWAKRNARWIARANRIGDGQ
jgi:hypothetical protein